MNRPITLKQMGIGILAVVAVLAFLGAADFAKRSSTPGGPTIASGPPALDPNKVPLTVQEIVDAGGYWALSPRQRQWVFTTIRDSLRRCRQAVKNRLTTGVATVPDFKARPQYEQMSNAISLINHALDELGKAGPDAIDPLVHSRLIDECVEALQR
jgi:hypothetical protein